MNPERLVDMLQRIVPQINLLDEFVRAQRVKDVGKHKPIPSRDSTKQTRKMDADRFVQILLRYIPHIDLLDEFVRAHWDEILKKCFRKELKRLERFLIAKLKQWLTDHGIPVAPGNKWVESAIEGAIEDIKQIRIEEGYRV